MTIIFIFFLLCIFILFIYLLAFRNSSKTIEKLKLDDESIIKVKNPIDGNDMLWINSEFTKNNFPGLEYEIEEKKKIFELSQKNKLNYGVIDVGAHIGDLAIPLALALMKAGRSDVIVYAIDPSKEKCDFMKYISKINNVTNIKIFNCGLSENSIILGHHSFADINNKNTGGQHWDIKSNIIHDVNNSRESESNLFIPLDTLYNNKDIGMVGLYHIDVEGHEIDVLKGSKNTINSSNPIILVEIFISNDIKCKDSHECKNLFETINAINSNYKFTDIMPNGDLIFQHT